MKIIPIYIILLLFIEFIYVLILNRILNIVIILLIKLFIYNLNATDILFRSIFITLLQSKIQ